MVLFKNNSQRLRDEFEELFRRNNDLYRMLLDVGDWCMLKFKKDIVVTMILRTQAEQDAIYKGKVRKDGRKYDEKPWKSPHQFWHSVDLRSSTFTKEQIKEIEDYINERYKSLNYYKLTAENHDVGLGDHFHVQFWPK